VKKYPCSFSLYGFGCKITRYGEHKRRAQHGTRHGWLQRPHPQRVNTRPKNHTQSIDHSRALRVTPVVPHRRYIPAKIDEVQKRIRCERDAKETHRCAHSHTNRGYKKRFHISFRVVVVQIIVLKYKCIYIDILYELPFLVGATDGADTLNDDASRSSGRANLRRRVVALERRCSRVLERICELQHRFPRGHSGAMRRKRLSDVALFGH
jgi:hypothetical protein